MPGTPATTTRLSIPRYAQGDAAVFATDVNAIVDQIDSVAAKQTDLEAEVSRAEDAETDEATARASAISAEATARSDADDAEQAARIAGDELLLVHVATWAGDTSPPMANGVLVGMVPAPVVDGQTYALVGAAVRCVTKGATPSVFKVQTDNGHGNGALSDATNLTALTPDTGRFVQTNRKSGGVDTPLPLNSLDTVAVVCVTQGNSLGCAIALLFSRSVS